MAGYISLRRGSKHYPQSHAVSVLPVSAFLQEYDGPRAKLGPSSFSEICEMHKYMPLSLRNSRSIPETESISIRFENRPSASTKSSLYDSQVMFSSLGKCSFKLLLLSMFLSSFLWNVNSLPVRQVENEAGARYLSFNCWLYLNSCSATSNCYNCHECTRLCTSEFANISCTTIIRQKCS